MALPGRPAGGTLADSARSPPAPLPHSIAHWFFGLAPGPVRRTGTANNHQPHNDRDRLVVGSRFGEVPRFDAPRRSRNRSPERTNTINTQPPPHLYAYTAIDVATELNSAAGRDFVRTCIRNTATGNDYGLTSPHEANINRLAHQIDGTRTGVWEVPEDLIDTETLLIVTVTGNNARARFINGTTDPVTIPIAVPR